MGNLINLPNITSDAMLNETASTVTKKTETGAFNVKNYLNVRLDEEAGETQKSITIRLLPMDLETGSPFVKVHIHNVKVPHEVSKSGYKSYICLSKNKDIDHEKYGNKCPFCEINKAMYQQSMEEQDPAKKKALQEASIANLSKEAVIVRCIERGKEDEGVKFWKFNVRADKTDPYNQILNLYNQRRAEGEAAGIPTNILDIYNGVDLTVKITEGNSAPTITDGRFACPLSKDEEQMKAWIYDTKRWQDVFTPKPYEYLSIISQMKTPWFDKSNNMWVDKDEYDSVNEAKKAVAENDVRAAESAITGGTIQVTTKKDDFVDSLTVKDNDLPW
jgi:hypothetical protein